LIEAVIATALFLVLLVISIGPIMSSLDRLDNARLTTEAEKLGEAQLESIRALDFDDVGLTAGNPVGLIEASMSMPGDTAWLITTDVQWEGAITGTDDVNYKTVEITVAHPDSAVDPVRFSSIISPDRLSDSSNKATVNVDVLLMEPTASGITPPKVFLIKSDGAGASNGAVFPLSGASPTEWTFPLLNPTDPNVGDPAYEMVMRLGTDMADTSFNGWYIAPNALSSGADRFQLFPAEIHDATLPVYRPAQLSVTVTDVDTGLIIPDATLKLDNGALTETFTTSDGTFFIEDAFGYPLAPDTYDITVGAFSYASETRGSVTLPAGYPDPLHVENFALEFQTGVPVTFDVEDTADWPIPLATISVPGFPDLTTDEYGRATMVVPVGPSFTATIISPAGHASATVSFNSGSGTVYKELGRPSSNYRLVHFYNGTGHHWGAKEYYGSEPYSHIEPDYNGNGTAVVYAQNTRWSFGLLCSDDPDDVEWQWTRVRVRSRTSILNVNAGGASC
jgi:hypothetical protein